MSRSPLHDADWTPALRPDVQEPDPRVEQASAILCGVLLILACVGWYLFYVRPHDEVMFSMIECVGDRAPTPEVVHACGG